MKRKDANDDEEYVRATPKHWNQAKARFGLTREELAMAKETGDDPLEMDKRGLRQGRCHLHPFGRAERPHGTIP